jgi:membrane protein required for colicin V production
VFLAAWIVRTTLRRWKFEAFDRHLGLILGGLEGGFLGLVATVFVVSLAPQTRAPIFASPAGKVVCQVLDAIEPALPGEIRAELSPFWSQPDSNSLAGQAPTPAVSRDNADTQGPGDAPRDADLKDLVEQGEAKIGRAIVEAAKRGLDGAGRADERDIERR